MREKIPQLDRPCSLGASPGDAGLPKRTVIYRHRYPTSCCHQNTIDPAKYRPKSMPESTHLLTQSTGARAEQRQICDNVSAANHKFGAA